MAYTNPRGFNANSDIGKTLVTECACTLADYTVAGTAAPAVGDVVTFSSTGDWFVKIVPDNTTKLFGRVSKIDLAPAGTAQGKLTVEWLDVLGFRWVTCSSLANMTRGNSAIKNGDSTVVDDFDALATTGNLVVVAKSAATGAGTAVCALLA